MWTGYKILIFFSLTTDICTETHFSQGEAEPGPRFTRNHTIFEGSRHKRAIFQGEYCRRFGCCEARDDTCVTQFYEANALCYCDSFCERDTSDCCPDYKSFCHEEKEEPPFQQPSDPEGRWTAQNYSQFWGMTLEEGFKFRLGTLPPSPMLLSMNEMTASFPPRADLPEIFIASYKWPGWTHGPLDQKNCAASWAFSTASVAADRIAIQSKGRYTANLSPQNLISCCAKNRHGCNSGSIDRAWWFLRKRGLVSHACYPLFKDQNTTNNICAMASRSDGRGKRHATKPCPNSFEKSNRIYQCSPPYRVSSNETEIMREIIQNGPVQAIMQVHEDFFYYKTGIYRHVVSTNEEPEKYKKLRTHAVKLTGWGTLRGARGKKEKFWIAANSWGKSWGENGYFRILRGVNESDIEKLIIAAWGQLTSSDDP
ncbi:tubulointerstitial nephritis antigen isoform X1 [Mus musculus]|uniref:tubulointerstitial nephritis antigen isoform X1 n=1 Tax=Mus musculus TaxID=10090 RepID=UPI0003D705C8|nr:tubulointerstitial nephritis antigen isoform X1 [Mus musculus]|eukprot:XP_006511264.1 PREDICTED: tubulointerstitial nephritis antigen isoform X1 [Mus musculus]